MGKSQVIRLWPLLFSAIILRIASQVMSPTLPSVFTYMEELQLVRKIGDYGNNQPTLLNRVFFPAGDIRMIARGSLEAIGGNVTPNTTPPVANPANVAPATSELADVAPVMSETSAYVTPVTICTILLKILKDPNGRKKENPLQLSRLLRIIFRRLQEINLATMDPDDGNQPAAAPRGAFRDAANPRATEEFLPGLRTSRTQRAALTGRELEKLRSSATEALASVFEHYLPTKGISCLEEAYDLQMRAFQLSERLDAFEMKPVFMVMREFDPTSGFIVGTGDPIDVLANPSSVTMAQVQRSNLFYRTFGVDNTTLQDLDWSNALLESSSADSLRNQVFERIVDVPASERGGPLFYKLMMDIVTSVRPESIETLIQSLRGLTLQDESFPGEDLDRVNQLIRGTINRLKMVGAIPHDIYRVVCCIYQTSTTPEFNAKFQLLSNLQELGQPTAVSNYSSLLAKGEEEFRTFHANGTWCAASKRKAAKKSVFIADHEGSTALAKMKCHKCGKEGHLIKDCPNPKAADNNPLRTPPAETAPQKKKFKDKDGTMSERFWCSKCNLWNKTHLGKDHRSKAEVAADGTGGGSPVGMVGRIVPSVSPAVPTVIPPDVPRLPIEQPSPPPLVGMAQLNPFQVAALRAQEVVSGLLE
jgi:hypothetical protein